MDQTGWGLPSAPQKQRLLVCFGPVFSHADEPLVSLAGLGLAALARAAVLTWWVLGKLP